MTNYPQVFRFYDFDFFLNFIIFQCFNNHQQELIINLSGDYRFKFRFNQLCPLQFQPHHCHQQI